VFGNSSFRQRVLLITTFAVIALIFAIYVSKRPMDFRVYHYGARGVFDGTRPVYGTSSGLGWPMHYRYPPLFLLLFAPLAMLPLGLAAPVWLLAKFAVLFWLIHALWKRGLKPPTTQAYCVAALFILPYIIEDFRYGNAQFFVVAMTIVALFVARDRPMLAASCLGLAISIKVWPLFFLPYLVVRRDVKVVAGTVAVVLVLAFLPSLYFGFSGNIHLLGQWFAQERQTQLSENEIWFPNQSLRGVLMRYLTVVDYSQVPDKNYAQVHVAAMDPATVRWVWMIAAGAAYAGFLLLVNWRRKTNGWLDHGLAFCLLALLEPFTQKYALVVLLLPAIIAARLMKRPFDILLYIATALILIQPLTPGASAQRFLQVLGFDFVATLLVTVALTVACLRPVDEW
jgi:alpha-1,2-mannosyltransferase